MSGIVRYPEHLETREQVPALSDEDLKQAAEAAFDYNVWSPIAKAVLTEVVRRWKQADHD